MTTRTSMGGMGGMGGMKGSNKYQPKTDRGKQAQRDALAQAEEARRVSNACAAALTPVIRQYNDLVRRYGGSQANSLLSPKKKTQAKTIKKSGGTKGAKSPSSGRPSKSKSSNQGYDNPLDLLIGTSSYASGPKSSNRRSSMRGDLGSPSSDENIYGYKQKSYNGDGSYGAYGGYGSGASKSKGSKGSKSSSGSSYGYGFGSPSGSYAGRSFNGDGYSGSYGARKYDAEGSYGGMKSSGTYGGRKYDGDGSMGSYGTYGSYKGIGMGGMGGMSGSGSYGARRYDANGSNQSSSNQSTFKGSKSSKSSKGRTSAGNQGNYGQDQEYSWESPIESDLDSPFGAFDSASPTTIEDVQNTTRQSAKAVSRAMTQGSGGSWAGNGGGAMDSSPWVDKSSVKTSTSKSKSGTRKKSSRPTTIVFETEDIESPFGGIETQTWDIESPLSPLSPTMTGSTGMYLGRASEKKSKTKKSSKSMRSSKAASRSQNVIPFDEEGPQIIPRPQAVDESFQGETVTPTSPLIDQSFGGTY